MYNTTETEAFLTGDTAEKQRAGAELATMCATHLCTVATLLSRQDQGMDQRDLQDVAALVRELATLGVAAHLLPATAVTAYSQAYQVLQQGAA